MYLILQLQCLFNTPANFTFTGKFHTDNTQHLSPIYLFPHLPSQTQPTHISDSPSGLWTYIPTFSYYQIQSTHTHQPVSDSTDIYISDIPTGLCTYIPTLAINMPPKLPNSADTPTKLNTPTDVELNNSSQSTYLPRYQTQPTHLPNYTHQLV